MWILFQFKWLICNYLLRIFIWLTKDNADVFMNLTLDFE